MIYLNFITRFVCREDELPEAKARYLAKISEDKEVYGYNIVAASEDAFVIGESLIFDLLFEEICNSELENREDYQAYLFSTIVEMPDHYDPFDLQYIFNIDGDEVPARFPCRVRVCRMSSTGQEIDKWYSV